MRYPSLALAGKRALAQYRCHWKRYRRRNGLWLHWNFYPSMR